MKMQRDGKGQLHIEWCQVEDGCKRAWVQHRPVDDEKKNWAKVPDGRYLNIVRCDSPGQPGGNATDFPIFNGLSDEQVLLAFVHSVNAITGCPSDVPIPC